MYPTKKLSEVVNTIRGITYKPDQLRSKEEGIACFRTKNIQDALDEDDIYYVDPSILRNNDKILETGDILISSANSLEQLGKCCLIQNLDYKATLGGFICAMRPNKDILNYKYFYLYFSSNKIQKKVRTFSKKTTGIANLQLKDVENLQIPLPPLSTQSKIVAKLDEAFDNIDRQIELLKANIEDVESVRKNALEESFQSGECEIKRVSEVFKIKSGDFLPKSAMIETGEYNVYGGNGINGRHDKFNLDGENILIGRVGALCGNIHYTKGTIWLTDNAFYISEYFTEVNKQYLTRFLRHANLGAQSNSSAQPVISYKSILNIQIPLPPLPRQHEIVEHLDRVFAHTAELRSSYEAQIRDLETLRQSLLEEAFSGRLVSE